MILELFSLNFLVTILADFFLSTNNSIFHKLRDGLNLCVKYLLKYLKDTIN